MRPHSPSPSPLITAPRGTARVLVSNTGTFIRNVQITGDLATGDVYIAGMDEGGGGFPHNDTNYIFKSTDGGNTWTNTYTGPTFPGPGVGSVGYFAVMFPDGGGYWRYEGWGEPAALNGIVHLVYAQQGAGSDPGDVYYIRSTDGGVTFGTPFKLNTDATPAPNGSPACQPPQMAAVFADVVRPARNRELRQRQPSCAVLQDMGTQVHR